MGFETIRWEQRGPEARLTFCRPPLNVLNIAMMEEVHAALAGSERWEGVKVLVLAAEGKAFSAGVDVGDHLGERMVPMIQAFHQIFYDLAAAPAPVVAVVQGAALGGGMEIAAACDLVLASEKAEFGQPEIRLGLFPPVGVAAYAARYGWQRAMECLLLGENLSAAEAQRWGLVNRVVPAERLEEEAEALVRRLCEKSGAALRLTRRAVQEVAGRPFEEALRRVEAIYLNELMQTRDANEGLQAFLEKRAPVWENR